MYKKKKVLWVGESSFLSTGYGVYLKELFTHLYNTNRYELAELSAYGDVDDPRRYEIPWTYYGNMPSKHDKVEQEIYRSNIEHQWGSWRFEDTLLDFQPDIICSIRDPWVDSFIMNSPLRPYFNWVNMPTIDSLPQPPQWINQFCNTNAILTYSEFGEKELKKRCGNKINFIDIASPAANYNILKPVENKKEHKEKMGFEKNVLIIGNVMRNQRRKLFPDLIQSFEKFCLTNKELSKNIYLYLHTAIQDIGWDIPKLIKESSIGHRILLTYMCRRCGFASPSLHHGTTQTCLECGYLAAKPPDTDQGVTTKQLSDIINCFDIYVQYSQCEGYGMPIVEAAACGIPVMVVNYSAMEDFVKTLNATPIKVERFYTEAETNFLKAYPDNDDLVNKLVDFFTLSENERIEFGKQTAKLCRKHYSYDKAAKVWMKAIDSISYTNWNQPPRIHKPNLNIPDGLTNKQFVEWCVINIWGAPEKLNDYYVLRMIKDLEIGSTPIGDGLFYNDFARREQTFMSFTRDSVVQECVGQNKKNNNWEKIRAKIIKKDIPDFIRFKKQ